MERSPPPFFQRGPAPIVRLAFFAALSIALIVLDARFRYAGSLRTVIATIAWPIQRFALAPVALAGRIGEFFASQSRLQEENAGLRVKLVESGLSAQRHEAAEAEVAQLRRLIGAAAKTPRPATPAEIVYAHRDPYSQRVWIDRGSQAGIATGSPVVDQAGVVGQVTRSHPLAAEVTLLTDRDHAIPVQVLRNGLRAVAFGAGSGLLELRFLASNAEVESGDRLVTSGIDGVYPPGLAVATVIRVERDAARSFARIVCEPAAGVERGRYVLVLGTAPEAARPDAVVESDAARTSDRSRRTRRRELDAGNR